MGQELEDQADDLLEEVRGDESRHDDAVVCGRAGWTGHRTRLACSRLRRCGVTQQHGRPPPAAQDRELKGVAIAAGARDNGTCLESWTPDIRLIDVGHACQSLKAAGRCR